MSFVNLHVHSHYSVLEALGSPKRIINAIKEQGQNAIAITDLSALYGAIEFYKYAIKEDIKPIVGCDIYITEDNMENKNIQNFAGNRSIVLLAKNNNGYKNLIKLASIAALDGFYFQARIDHDTLKKYAEDLICLSGNLNGPIPFHLLNNQTEKAEDLIITYKNIFKEDFYLELIHNPESREQQQVNQKLIALSKKHNVNLIVTNNSFYIKKEDKYAHDILVAINDGRTIYDEKKDGNSGDFYLKDEDELKEAFPYNLDAIERTQEIADKCNVSFEFGNNIMPDFKIKSGESTKDYLRKLCEEGLEAKFGKEQKEAAKKQLEYELQMINDMGFNTYFLIVHDFIKFAKDRKIVVGPGRGSAAGSIVSFCLNITTINPLDYNLIFERFLNPARITMPDIDIDFADDRREEVMDYVKNKYGKQNVSQVITFGTMAAKAAVKDTGRALGYPYAEVDAISKKIPAPIQGRHTPLEISIKDDKELSKEYNDNPRAKRLLDNAIKLEGSIRNTSTHACAVLITDKPLTEYIPLQIASGSETEIVTQYSYKQAEDLGLLKMDFLGLRNLTIINNTLKILKKTRKLEIDIDAIKLDDEKTYKLMQDGLTIGVFQLESPGMRRYLKQLKPNEFEDIIAMISLYRPGPMEWIPDFIKGKHGEREVKFPHVSLEPILKTTYGIGVYQEQILQIAQVFAGFSLGEADLLRRAIGKKIPEELKAQRQKFLEGAKKLKRTQKKAIEIFDKVIEPFAGYGFNKSHAACYAMLSYETGYLKANYPTEFMTALLTADSSNPDKIAIEINECENLDIKVLPPAINESLSNFTVVNKGEIRFGLSAIKGIGENAVEEIIQIRGVEPFKSLEDFVTRVPSKLINKKSLSSLILSGALDQFGNRSLLYNNIEKISKFSKSSHEEKASNQIDLFGGLEDSDIDKLHLDYFEPFSNFQKLTYEKQFLGLYVSDHPLKNIKAELAKLATSVDKVLHKKEGSNVKVAGLYVNSKKIKTRSGMIMSMGQMEDATNRIKVVIFPKVYEKYSAIIGENKLIIMNGKLDKRDDDMQVIVNSVGEIEIKENKNIENGPRIIKIEKSIPLSTLKEIKALLKASPGSDEIEIQITIDRKLQKIKVPFGVKYDSRLQKQIEDVLS